MKEEIVVFVHGALIKQKQKVRILALRSFLSVRVKNRTFPGEMLKSRTQACEIHRVFSNLVLTLRQTCCVSLGNLIPLSGPRCPHL